MNDDDSNLSEAVELLRIVLDEQRHPREPNDALAILMGLPPCPERRARLADCRQQLLAERLDRVTAVIFQQMPVHWTQ